MKQSKIYKERKERKCLRDIKTFKKGQREGNRERKRIILFPGVIINCKTKLFFKIRAFLFSISPFCFADY